MSATSNSWNTLQPSATKFVNRSESKQADILLPKMEVAVVIPCFRVKTHVLEVIAKIGNEVTKIYAIDDKCPEETGAFLEKTCHDPRLKVIFHDKNQGVGGATISGFKAALMDGAQIIIKVDGDGQMDPALIPNFIYPIENGIADYVKGNRFFDIDSLSTMPKIRLIGNAALSFISKVSSGYWNIMDPTNGYVAIHASVLRILPLDKIDRRYFFESDMLFRLNTIRAVVHDLPMNASYGSEKSSLKISHTLFEFSKKHVHRALKRIIYNYLLRDFNLGTVQFFSGLPLIIGGATFGLYKWHQAALLAREASAGTVMIATLPIIVGIQLVLAALQYEVSSVPTQPLQQTR